MEKKPSINIHEMALGPEDHVLVALSTGTEEGLKAYQAAGDEDLGVFQALLEEMKREKGEKIAELVRRIIRYEKNERTDVSEQRKRVARMEALLQNFSQ